MLTLCAAGLYNSQGFASGYSDRQSPSGYQEPSNSQFTQGYQGPSAFQDERGIRNEGDYPNDYSNASSGLQAAQSYQAPRWDGYQDTPSYQDARGFGATDDGQTNDYPPYDDSGAGDSNYMSAADQQALYNAQQMVNQSQVDGQAAISDAIW